MGCGVRFFCLHLMPCDCRDPGRTIDRSRKFHYPATKVPGTCRLQTKVTVKPGSRRPLTLEAFRAVGNAGSHAS